MPAVDPDQVAVRAGQLIQVEAAIFVLPGEQDRRRDRLLRRPRRREMVVQHRARLGHRRRHDRRVQVQIIGGVHAEGVANVPALLKVVGVVGAVVEAVVNGRDRDIPLQRPARSGARPAGQEGPFQPVRQLP